MKTGHTALVLLALLALGASAHALALYYVRYKLFELVATADLVVTGTIRSVEVPPSPEQERRGVPQVAEPTFTLKIEQRIAGEASSASIDVRCFRDWTCAGRWTSYSPGQRVLLFLTRPAKGTTVYTILGGGGEGEMPLVGQSVCVRGYSVLGYDDKMSAIDGAQVDGPLIALEELAHAIVGFRDAYAHVRGADSEYVGSIQPKGALDQVATYAASSKTAHHLHEQAVSSEAWRGALPESTTHVLPADAPRIEAHANGLSGLARFPAGVKPSRSGFGLHTGFGRSAAFVGDVDGNGVVDLAVGAPSDCYSGHAHGALWIVLRAADQGQDRIVEISERQGGFPARLADFGNLGVAVAAVGDLDGDEVPDLCVGAPAWDEREKHRGGVWLLSLARDGTVARARELGSDPKLVDAGARGPVGIGKALANLGDLDGDGLPELAIGQDPTFDFGWERGRAVLIASLGKHGEIRWASRIDPKQDGFYSSYAWFGEALAGVGDIDGDGVRDLACANSGDSDGGESRGAVWIVFLTADGRVKAKQKISDWHGNFTGLLRDGSGFGAALGGTGDLDGDKIPDLLVSSREGVWTLFLARDGTVRAHVVNRSALTAEQAAMPLGTSFAIAPSETNAGSVALAVGGTIGAKRALDGAVWLLRANADGSLTK
jgi:hypothetical protein